MKNIKIAPSILAADFTKLGDEIRMMDKLGVDMFHFDVMDGHFVPNISFGALVLDAIKPLSKTPMDVHLMVSNPEQWIEPFAASGADYITIHAETTPHLDRALSLIREKGCKAGVSLTPQTHESCLDYLMDRVDMILVMTVNPGFGGQKFLHSQLEKITNIRKKIGNRPIRLQVDGGITPQTAPLAVKAGADVLVAGSALFGGDSTEKMRAFKDALSACANGITQC